MATVDRKQRRVVARVVFDGPARAGKSTNLAHVPSLFPSSRRGELVTPHQTHGRTDYFDFIEVRGGTVAGLDLYGQFVSVPGQDALFHRRRFLLRGADCIVFVCAATESGLADARRAWSEMLRVRSTLFEHDPPEIVLQINKLDLASEGAVERVKSALGVGDDVRVIGAAAQSGSGVRETVIRAFRAAADRAQRALADQRESSMAGAVDDANSLLIAMQLHSEPPEPPPFIAGGPLLPAGDVPDDLVWPESEGHRVLRRALAAEPRKLPPRHEGDHDVIYESGLWRISTKPDHRFDALDAGRKALAEMGAVKRALGSLTPRSQALVLQPDAGERCWLWTIEPWFTCVRDQLAHAARRMDVEAFGETLVAYAGCLVEAVRMAIGHGVAIELGPENFAIVGPAIYYVGHSARASHRLTGIGCAALSSLGDDPAFFDANERYLESLENGLRTRFSADELRRVGLDEELRSLATLTAEGERARSRLLALTARGSVREAKGL